jgi:peptidyl-prolyl cis-trans isomerase D
MLGALRKGAGGWLAQLFIALLVVSFAIWGVSDIFSGFRSDTIATVGGTDISVQEFARQYEQAKRQIAQRLGQPLTDQQAQLFGVPSQVLSRLVTDATLNDEASSFGLGVSGETLAKQIADDPTFQGPTGAFDRARFVQALNGIGITEDQFVEELRKSYVRQQLASALIGAMKLPDAYMRAFNEYQNEERDMSYLVLPPTLVTDITEPSDTDLTAFFNEHKSDWRLPELRSVRIMKMTPEDLANASEITDEDAKKVYDTQLAARFTTPERRQVEQIVFKDAGDASAAAAALADGTTFDALLAERGLKPADVDLGLVTRDKLLDPKVAEAAFSLAPNSVSGVVDGQFGPVILRVTTVEPEVVKTFDEVKDQIKKELAEARAAQEISDQLNVIEDARAGGSTLDEIAKNYDLKVVTYPAIDSEGKNADGEPIADLPGGKQLVSAVFETDVGLENNPLPLDKGYVWYEVTAVSAERDRELAEVRDKVVAAYKKAEVDKELTKIADDIRDRLAHGEAIDAIAKERGVEVQTAKALKRATAPSGELTADAITAAFDGPKGYVAVAPGVDQAKIVLVATESTIPPYFSGAPDLSQAEERLTSDIGNDLLGQYITQLQQRLGVAVNQVALQQVIGVSQPGS